MEHRRVQRYRVSLPITFFWGSDSNYVEGSGTSRDLSIRGAFVLTADEVTDGSELWLKVSVPAIREGLKGSEMQGTGRVVRVQVEGFAVEAPIAFSMQPNHKPREATKKSRSSVHAEPESVGAWGV